MERRIAALENELVKQLKVNDMLEMRLKQLKKAHKGSIEVGSTGEGGVPGSDPSDSTSLNTFHYVMYISILKGIMLGSTNLQTQKDQREIKECLYIQNTKQITINNLFNELATVAADASLGLQICGPKPDPFHNGKVHFTKWKVLLMDNRSASPVSPQLSKNVNSPSGHKSSLREAETKCTEVRKGRGKLGGELQNVEAVPHSTDDLQTSVINKGHGEDASKRSERGSDEQIRKKPEKRKEAETRKVERRSNVARRSGCNPGSHYVGRRKVWGTRRSVTVESVTGEIEKVVESKGEINVRRVEFDTEKGVKWWFWVESEERILQELTSKCNWEHWELQSMPFLGDAKVRVLPKKGKG